MGCLEAHIESTPQTRSNESQGLQVTEQSFPDKQTSVVSTFLCLISNTEVPSQTRRQAWVLSLNLTIWLFCSMLFSTALSTLVDFKHIFVLCLRFLFSLKISYKHLKCRDYILFGFSLHKTLHNTSYIIRNQYMLDLLVK